VSQPLGRRDRRTSRPVTGRRRIWPPAPDPASTTPTSRRSSPTVRRPRKCMKGPHRVV